MQFEGTEGIETRPPERERRIHIDPPFRATFNGQQVALWGHRIKNDPPVRATLRGKSEAL